MAVKTGIDDRPPHGHDAKRREEGMSLHPERRKRIHRPQEKTPPQGHLQSGRAVRRMRHAHEQRREQGCEDDSDGGALFQVAFGDDQFRFVDFVDFDVGDLIESRDVEVHEQGGNDGVSEGSEGGGGEEGGVGGAGEEENGGDGDGGSDESVGAGESPEDYWEWGFVAFAVVGGVFHSVVVGDGRG